MTPEELEACWKDPHNWNWAFYYCKADPRVIVPKRFKWAGWTINAARPSAIPVVLLVAAIVAVPALIARASGGGKVVEWATIAVTGAIVCLLCAYLSSSKRWNH
jgi:Family of unknown function (DUF5808)